MMKLNRHWLTLIRWLYSLPVAGAIVYVTLYGHDLNPIRVAAAAGVLVIAALGGVVFELVFTSANEE
jgi:hypothetical protein